MTEGRGLRQLMSQLVSRISLLEKVCAAIAAVVFIGLVIADTDIVEAPWQSERAIAAVVGGTVLAAIALLVMLYFRVPAVARVVVLGVPLVVTSWWLIEPFFDDDVVRQAFDTSIVAERRKAQTGGQPDAATPTPTAPAGPQLLGSGKFVGLAGHDGTGDAGIFRLPDGSFVLRLERFDIDNGPDLELYLVPGADRRSPTDRSHHFGALKGNIGDQTYDIPASYPVSSGPWTVLVWCKAFTVEFVAATVEVA